MRHSSAPQPVDTATLYPGFQFSQTKTLLIHKAVWIHAGKLAMADPISKAIRRKSSGVIDYLTLRKVSVLIDMQMADSYWATLHTIVVIANKSTIEGSGSQLIRISKSRLQMASLIAEIGPDY